MRLRRRAQVTEDYTNPATESIDEALARLARQDSRLNPVEPAAATRRAIGPSRATRDRLLVVVRWVVILVVAVLVWRFALGDGR
jgi:hypothetical protein